MIYRHVLVASGPIADTDFRQTRQTLLMRGSRYRFRDIDSILLLVCREIYKEAAPVLYGNNVFRFSDPEVIEEFAFKDLRMTSPGKY